MGGVQIEGQDENKFSKDDGRPLKVDGLPTIVIEVADLEHSRVDILRALREQPFKVCEEWRIVESPF